MTDTLLSTGRWMLRRPAHWLAPALAALMLTNWIVSESGRGPWPDLLAFMIPAAIMLGVSPWVPAASLALMVALPLAQLAGLVVRPDSTTWPVYLTIAPTALVIGATAGPRVRRYALLVGFVSATVIAYLMAAPGPQGSWANWMGTELGERQFPHEQDFVLLAATGFALFLIAWFIGVLYRLGTTGRLARVAALFAEPAPAETALPTIAGLSPRELEIFALVARGLSNAEIAGHEHISEATVKSHVSSILRKLGLRSRTQLAAHAHEVSTVSG